MANLAITNYNTRRIISGVLTVLALAVLMNLGFWFKHLQYFLGFTRESTALSLVRLEANMISIPTLDIVAPVVFVQATDNSTFQKALKGGVVHHPDTAQIGEKGNPYIFGHSSNYFWVKSKYNTIFALLPKIQVGDSIYASNGTGQTFEYIVTETRVVSPRDTQWLDQHDKRERMLTLQTSYPVGTALKRFIVIAKIK